MRLYKGGAIKWITEHLSLTQRIVALPTSTERGTRCGTSSVTSLTYRAEARSCSSTAPGTTAPSVEKVMGFCTPEEYYRFLRQTPIFEQMLIDDGIILRKYCLPYQTRSNCGAFGPGMLTQYAAGKPAPWTWSRSTAGRTTPGPRTR